MRQIVLPRPTTSPSESRSLWNRLTARRYTPRQLAFFALGSIVLLLFLFLTPGTGSQDPFNSVIWSPRNATYPQSSEPSRVWEQRAESVKQAFIHAYSGYEKHASLHDELRPLSNTSTNSWVLLGISYTLLLYSCNFVADLMDGVSPCMIL